MSSVGEFRVPPEVVTAAIRAAEQCGRDVADVPLETIADVAAISRSTLLRRIGGSRKALDDAVRAVGVDPGGRSVRERAVKAGAWLISERGPSAVTLEAVADSAGCSVPGLYVAFGNRDNLFAAIYEKYSPLGDLMNLCANPTAGLEQTVAEIYRILAVSLDREPRVATAMLADVFGNPHGPAARVFARYFPRALAGVGGWLQAEAAAGRIRDLPVEVLMQQLIGPLMAHMLMRRALVAMSQADAVNFEEVCSTFTDTFLRAVAIPQSREERTE